MAKNYDISKKSDLRQLEKDLMNAVNEEAKNKASQIKYEIECPHCNAHISVYPGLSVCPQCRQQIELTLDFQF